MYISPETAAIISYNTKVGMWTLESSLLIESFVASSFVSPPKTGYTSVQFPYEYSVYFNGVPFHDEWPLIKIPKTLGKEIVNLSLEE